MQEEIEYEEYSPKNRDCPYSKGDIHSLGLIDDTFIDGQEEEMNSTLHRKYEYDDSCQ